MLRLAATSEPATQQMKKQKEKAKKRPAKAGLKPLGKVTE
jgi:hypothetical protein